MLGVPGLAHGLYVKSLALTGMEIRVGIHLKGGPKNNGQPEVNPVMDLHREPQDLGVV